MTNKQTIDGVSRKAIEVILGYKEDGYVAAWKELRALLDKPACVKCNDTGEVDSGREHPWGEGINITCECEPAAQPQSEVERMREEAHQDGILRVHYGKQIDTLRAQLAERDALLREMRDLATAIPVLMLAIKNPHDVASRDKHIEWVNTLIERCDATLSTSAEPKPRGEPVAHLSLCLKGPNKGDYIVVKELGASGNDIWSPDIPVYTDQPSHSGDTNEMVAKVVLPERMYSDSLPSWAEEQKLVRGWNACLDEVAKLNGLKP